MQDKADLSRLCVEAKHPSLPGHFPGRPIVPGVVLLNRVITRAETWLGQPVSIAGLQHAKFTQPLLPGEEATLSLTLTGTALKFEITRDTDRIAQGSLNLSRGPIE
jgi:3-hydroxyacyl-[acyl-carrier-protein] dehydratase